MSKITQSQRKAWATQEDAMRDIAIAITDKLVEQGFVKDCIDTDDEDEFGVQDIIHEILMNRKEVSNV